MKDGVFEMDNSAVIKKKQVIMQRLEEILDRLSQKARCRRIWRGMPFVHWTEEGSRKWADRGGETEFKTVHF